MPYTPTLLHSYTLPSFYPEILQGPFSFSGEKVNFRCRYSLGRRRRRMRMRRRRRRRRRRRKKKEREKEKEKDKEKEKEKELHLMILGTLHHQGSMKGLRKALGSPGGKGAGVGRMSRVRSSRKRSTRV